MKNYTVEVTETLRRSVEVDALNAKEAVTKVQSMYDDEEIVLDEADFSGVSFTLDEKSQELTKDIERSLLQWLPKSEKLFASDGKLIYQVYWDYSDSISTSLFREIMEFAKREKANFNEGKVSFEDIVLCYGWEDDWFDETACVIDYEIAREFIDSHLELFEIYNFHCTSDVEGTAIFDSLRELIYEHIEIDFNIGQLLKNTGRVNVTIFFDSCLFSDLDEAWAPGYEDLPETKVARQQSSVAWLLKTQGYTVEELEDKEKREQHPFLQRVWSELYDYRDLCFLNMVAVLPASFEDLFHYKFTGHAVIKAGTSFGFFNSFEGSGTGLEIEIIKDIVLDDEVYKESYIDSRKHGERYSWTVTDTYGKLFNLKGGLDFEKKD